MTPELFALLENSNSFLNAYCIVEHHCLDPLNSNLFDNNRVGHTLVNVINVKVIACLYNKHTPVAQINNGAAAFVKQANSAAFWDFKGKRPITGV